MQKEHCHFPPFPAAGLLIAALYVADDYTNEGWHRAVVTEIVDLEHVEVFYVDYGTKCVVALKFCRYLHEDFALLPGQAVHAKLAGIVPVNSSRWYPEAGERLAEWARRIIWVGHNLRNSGNEFVECSM